MNCWMNCWMRVGMAWQRQRDDFQETKLLCAQSLRVMYQRSRVTQSVPSIIFESFLLILQSAVLAGLHQIPIADHTKQDKYRKARSPSLPR